MHTCMHTCMQYTWTDIHAAGEADTYIYEIKKNLFSVIPEVLFNKFMADK